MATRTTYQELGHHSTTQGSKGDLNDFSNIQFWDIVTFLAIAQSMRIKLLDVQLDYHKVSVNPKDSWSSVVYRGKGVAFKRMFVRGNETQDFGSKEKVAKDLLKDVHQSLIWEIMVFRHPSLSSHPNIQRLLGIAFDVQNHKATPLYVLPVLVFEQSQQGDLLEYFKKCSDEQRTVGFNARLQFCLGIGNALEAMHLLNIAHGDIKPQNVLIFDNDGGQDAKVIDFGCSYFGSSADHEMKVRGYTIPWAAKEVIEKFKEKEGHNIEQAKTADIYSFGKLCAFILLSNDPETEESEPQHFSKYSGQEIADSGSTIHEAMPYLDLFFQQSFRINPAERKPISTLLKLLLKSQANCVPEVGIKRQKLPPLWKSIKNSLNRLSNIRRSFLAKIITLQGRKGAEFSVPGQLQIVFLFTNIIMTIIPITLLILFGLGVFMINSGLRTKTKKSAWAIIIVLAIILFIVMPVLGYRLYRSTRTDFRSVFRLFMIFGWNPHSVPSLPQLYPLLNRVHFRVRAQIFEDLRSRLQADETTDHCEICVSQTILQLALCYHTAFGTRRDEAKALELLERSKQKNFLALCKEIDFWERHYRSESIESGQGIVTKDLVTQHLPMNDLTIRDIPQAVDFYKAEIDGKIQAGVCTHSAAILQESLGDLYMNICLYEEAEGVYREAIQTVRKAPTFTGFWGIDRKEHDTLLQSRRIDLAWALQLQGKLEEAMQEIKSRISANPSHSYLHFRGRCVNLCLERYNSDKKDTYLWDANNIGLIPDLKAKAELFKKNAKETGENDSLLEKVARAINILGALAEAWNMQSTRGNKRLQTQSMEILHERVNICLAFFDKDSKETYKANHDLAVGFLQSGYGEPGRALMIQSQLLAQTTYKETDPERLKLMAAHALSLFKNGAYEDAVSAIDSILQIKRDTFGDTNSINLGCLMELAGSLSVTGKEALSTPAKFQHYLVSFLKTSSDQEIRTKTMDLLWSFSKPDYLQKVLADLESLIELMKSKGEFGHARKVQTFLIFVLSHHGFTYEDVTILDQAEKYNIELKKMEDEYFGIDCIESLSTLESMACIYWMKCNILCKRQGFGHQDLVILDRSLQMHEDVHSSCITMLNSHHPRTINAKQRWAIALSDIGFARDNEEMLEKANGLLEEAILLCFENQDSAGAESPDGNGNEISYAAYQLARLQFLRADIDPDPENLQFTYDNMREFLFGASEKFHRGEIAIREHLYSAMLEKSVKCFVASRKLNKGSRRFSGIRDKWSDSFYLSLAPNEEGELHPDYLRARAAYAKAEHQCDRDFNERSITRSLKWQAAQVHTAKSQYHCIMQYRMSHSIALSRDLSGDRNDWDQAMVSDCNNAIIIATEVVNHATEIFGKDPHTKTASFTKDLARLHWISGNKSEAKQLYIESIQMYSSVLGVKHPTTCEAWDSLLRRLAGKKGRAKLSVKVKKLLKKSARTDQMGHRVKSSDLSLLEKWVERAGTSRVVLGEEHIFSKGADLELQSLCVKFNLALDKTRSFSQDFEEFVELRGMEVVVVVED